MLSSSDSSGSDSEEEAQNSKTTLKINPQFASKFAAQQKYKDLQRTKELEAELEEDDESDSETEDEDAEALSTGLDLEIYRTIKSIRDGDKRIFDANAQWYQESSDEEDDEDEEGEPKASDKKSKKKTYKDIIRERALEEAESGDESSGGGERGEDGSSVRADRSEMGGRAKSAFAYDQEQKALRQSFLDSAKGIEAGSDDDEDEDGMLQVRSKTDDERKQEQKLLKGALKEIVNPKGEDAPEGDKFLYDYMLNKKWNFPKDTIRDEMMDAHDNMHGSSVAYGDDVSEEEKELDNVDHFESKYNFRFEELNDAGGMDGGAGGSSILGHARNVEGSVRRVDDRRKKERESRKERKEKERRVKEAELRRLKNVKKQEVCIRLVMYCLAYHCMHCIALYVITLLVVEV
jgi:protein KRI1